MMQLLLHHTVLGAVAYSVAWGVPFHWPHSEGAHLRAPLLGDLSLPTWQVRDSFGGALCISSTAE